MKENTSETNETDDFDPIDDDEIDNRWQERNSKELIEKLKSSVSFTRRGVGEIIRLCPHCVFQAVKIMPSYANFMIPNRYFCPKCDWQGPVALEASVSDLEQYLKDNPIDKEE